MTTKEQIGKAQHSRDLGEVQPDEIGDVDIIRACGMAAASNPLGLRVWRWRYNGDHRELPHIAEALIEQGYAMGVVGRVLIHLSSDVCPACHGRGYALMPNTPMLSDDICMDCRGVGRKGIDGQEEGALVEHLMRLEREIAASIMKKLAREMEF
jgi:hypothetical protein